jgi:hypothetical protein
MHVSNYVCTHACIVYACMYGVSRGPVVVLRRGGAIRVKLQVQLLQAFSKISYIAHVFYLYRIELNG